MDDAVDHIKLIEELQEIIKEYEHRLNAKDKNFQLQFSELQNELIQKYSQIEIANEEKNKLEFQITEFSDLIHEKDSVIKSKDNAIQIMQSDVAEQLNDVKIHYEELLSIRQEEIESLRMTSNQLREQLNLREDDIISMMQRHENQIVEISNNYNSKHDVDTNEYTIEALKSEVSDMREMMFQKQESIKVACNQIEEQDKLVRELQDKIVILNDEVKKWQKLFQDSQNDKCNDTIKENKKKQLSLKAKVNSLEKQCESLKSLSHKEDERYRNLNNELTIREQVIEKQNILIDELRQTEKNLQQKLDKVLILQQNQLIELQYWQDLSKLSPPPTIQKTSDESDELTAVQFFMDTVENLYLNESREMSDKIRSTIEQLKVSLDVVSYEIRHIKSVEDHSSLLTEYINRLHSYNMSLHRNSQALLGKFKWIDTSLVSSDLSTDNIDNLNLEDFSKEELILKLQIISQNSLNYSEEISKIELENLQKAQELKQVQRVIEENMNTKNVFMYEKEDLTEEVRSLKAKVKVLLDEIDNMKNIIESNIKENNELKKVNDGLKDELVSKDARLHEVETLCNDLKEEVSSQRFNLERSKKCEDVFEGSILSVKEENTGLLNVIDQIKCEKEQCLMDQNEEIEGLKSNIEKLRATEGDLRNECLSIIEERDKLIKVIEQLSDDVATRDKTIEDNSLLFIELNDKMISSEDKSKELNENLQSLVSENDKLLNKVGELEVDLMLSRNVNINKEDVYGGLKEELASAHRQLDELQISYNRINEECKSLAREKMELLKRNEAHEEDILLKSKEVVATEKSYNILKEEIAALKLKMNESHTKENMKNENSLLVMKENEELNRSMVEFKGRLLHLEKEYNEKTELCNNLNEQIASLKQERKDLSDQNLSFKSTLSQLNVREEFDKEQTTLRIEEAEQLQKVLHQLREVFYAREIGVSEKEILCNELDEELSKVKVDIEQSNINVKMEMEIVINKIKDALTLGDKNVEKCKIECDNLNTLVVSLKSELEALTVNENVLNDKLVSITEEKEQLQIKLNELMIDLLAKGKEINQKDVICENLKVEIAEVKLNFEREMSEYKLEIQKTIDTLSADLFLKAEKIKESDNCCKNLQEEVDLLKVRLKKSSDNEEELRYALNSSMEDKKEFEQDIEVLKGQLALFKKQINENELLINSLNAELMSVKLDLEQMKVDVDIANTDFSSLTAEKEDSQKVVDELNRQIQKMIEKDLGKDIIISDLEEESIRLKLKLEDSGLSEDQVNRKLTLAIEENEEYKEIIRILKDEIIVKEQETTEKGIWSQGLDQEVTILKSDLFQSKENVGLLNTQLMEIVKEREDLNRTINVLNENIALQAKEVEESATKYLCLKLKVEELNRTDEVIKERLISLTQENEDLYKMSENLKCELNNKEASYNEKERVCNLLNEELTALKTSIDQTNTNTNNELQGLIDDLKEELTSKSKQLEVLKEEKISLTVTVENLNERENIQEKELKLLKDENGVFSQKNSELSERLHISENKNIDNDKLYSRLCDKIAPNINFDESTKDEHSLEKYIDRVLEDLMLRSREKEDNQVLCDDLKEQISSLKSMLKKLSDTEDLLNERISSGTNENEMLQRTVFDLKNEMLLIESERNDRGTLIDDMKKEMISLKSDLQQSLLKEDIINSSLISITESKDKIIEELNEQIVSMKSVFEESSAIEEARNKKVVTMLEEKDGLKKLINEMQEILLLKDIEIKDKDALNDIIKGEVLSLKTSIDGLGVSESILKSELSLMAKERDELQGRLDQLQEDFIRCEKDYKEKESLLMYQNKEFITVKENLEELISKSLRNNFEGSNQIESDLNCKVHMLIESKEELERTVNRLNSDLSKKVSLETELNNCLKTIEKLEKNNLLLKAKSLKLMRQLDEKVSFSTTASYADKDKLEELVQKSEVRQESHFPQEIESPLNDFNLGRSDEILFISRIQSLTDDVDSKVRKANLEIEQFLERNEQVTRGLSSDMSPNRQTMCSNLHCQRMSNKNRDFSITIANLQQQNGLMKNKIMDLQSCLEHEQETRKQISQEGLLAHDALIHKLQNAVRDCEEYQSNMNESHQLLEKERFLVKNLSEELDQMKVRVKEERDVIDKYNQKQVSLLEARIKDVSDENHDLNLENKKLCRSVKSLTKEVDGLVAKYKESSRVNEEFLDNIKSLGPSNEKISSHCAVPTVELDHSLQLRDDEILVSINGLVESVTEVINDNSDSLDFRVGNLLRNNRIIEEKLIRILGRIDPMMEYLDVFRSSKVEDISEVTEREEEKESSITMEMILAKENEICILNGVILKQKEQLERCALAELESHEMMKEELIKSEAGFLKILKDLVPKGQKVIETDVTDDPHLLLSVYIDYIKNLLNDRFTFNNNMHTDYCQTIIGFTDLNSIDHLMTSIITDLSKGDTTIRCEGLEGPELWINGINLLNGQIKYLKQEISFLEQEKCELSEKFENLFVQLEMSCDAEMEEVKSANVFLNKELKSLQTEKDVREMVLKNYEEELSCLRSTAEKPEVENEKQQQLANNDNSTFWLSDLNDALKETISEKEDHITELMDKISESSTLVKESMARDEQHVQRIAELEEEVSSMLSNVKSKEAVIRDNNAVINELEAVYVEKENRIILLEKESAEINAQLEQYISAVCSMQARLEASKPNLELILTKIENKDKNLQLLNLIDQLEKDYAEELELTEITKSKVEAKLNKAIQIIHKLKKQLKEAHANEMKITDEMRAMKKQCNCERDAPEPITGRIWENTAKPLVSQCHDVCVQSEDDELRVLREENANYKGVIENLHVNNFLLWKELDTAKKTDRNVRGSSLPPMNVSGSSITAESERSVSPASQLSWNSCEGSGPGSNQVKDLQRKLERVHQQLNQMRIERNRIHQEYSRVRQLKEVADSKVSELMKKIDMSEDSDVILTEKDELVKANNQYSTQIVDLQSEIEMTKVRNSILETKCKKIELKLASQRRKYDQLVLKLDEKEQEIDRGSDELRKHTSNFEKEKIIWLREKREMKSFLMTKEGKIADLRKRLFNKTNDGESCDNDFLSEINQVQTQLDRQKSENKQMSAVHKEQINKFHGQIEELIDENRQLKRKLSFGHNENNIQIMETSVKSRPLKRIEEDSEEMPESSVPEEIGLNTVLANVVLEKEKLLAELLELRDLLNVERDKVLRAEKEMKIVNEVLIGRDLSDFLITKKEFCEVETVTEDFRCEMIDRCLGTSLECESHWTQTVENQKFTERSAQTDGEFYEHCFEIIKEERLKQNIDKSIQVCVQNVIVRGFRDNTDDNRLEDQLCRSSEVGFKCCGIQTDEDAVILDLQDALKHKNIAIQQYQLRLSKADYIQTESTRLKKELQETLESIGSLESKNLEYQELIGKLELKQIEKDKKSNKEIMGLKEEISLLTERMSETVNSVVELNDKADQTFLCQPADEGWDIEWDYEKMIAEHHMQDPGIKPKDNIEVSLAESSAPLELARDSEPVADNMNEGVIAILRDEVCNLKNIIGEKMFEIDQMKCLRNQLQNDLLESGQQIKDSNMEFLNLKESIQALHAERDILRQRVGESESQVKEMIHFTDMVTLDLQRLRDCRHDDIYAPNEDNCVKTVVQALERELHILVEQLQLKELKLESSLSKIEQLNCAVHLLQLQQTPTNGSMNEQPGHTFEHVAASVNHDHCISSINELSELLEKRHSEIEGLKSRLFLATDQLIHFRTFFANTDNRLHKELMLITRHNNLGFKDSASGHHSSTKDYTKVTLDSDDQSDSDQSILSHDGSTVIRVERSRNTPQYKSQYSLSFINQLTRSSTYKRLTHNFKRVFSAGRRHIVSLRSQPRINLRAVLTVYLALIHLLVLRCILL